MDEKTEKYALGFPTVEGDYLPTIPGSQITIAGNWHAFNWRCIHCVKNRLAFWR